MDKWTYRQLYRMAVGGNIKARLHWKKAGVDPQEKIETKYSSMVSHQYKTALEKDVAEACRRGLSAYMEKAAPKAAGPAVSSDPFADYFNSLSGSSPAPPMAAKTMSAGNLASLPKASAPTPAPANPPPTSAPISRNAKSLGDVAGAAAPTGMGPLGPLGPLGAGLPSKAATATPAAPVDLSDATPAPAAPSGLPASLAGIKPKPGMRKGGLGAKRVPMPSSAAPAEPEAEPPAAVAIEEEPAPSVVAAAPIVAPIAAPAPVPKPAPKPFKPLAPLPKALPKAAPAGGLSGAWAELEASTKAPVKPKPMNMGGLGKPPTAASTATPPAPPPATPSSAVAPPTSVPTASNGSSNGDGGAVPSLFASSMGAAVEATPVAPLFSSAGAKPKAKPTTAKKLGASRVATGGVEKVSSFGDFDFGEDGAEGDGGAAGAASAAGGGSGDWGGDDWASPQSTKAPPPPPPVDDPWADAGRPPQSSLFAYDCSSLHAASAPTNPSSSKPAAKKSLFDNVGLSVDVSEPPAPADDSNGFGGFGASMPRADDTFNSFARDKFGGATAISSSSFASARPNEAAPTVDPAVRAAEEAAAKERRLQELGLAGASGFGSSDLEDPTSPGRARQMAGAGMGAARAVGGAAMSFLSRGGSSPKKEGF